MFATFHLFIQVKMRKCCCWYNFVHIESRRVISEAVWMWYNTRNIYIRWIEREENLPYLVKRKWKYPFRKDEQRTGVYISRLLVQTYIYLDLLYSWSSRTLIVVGMRDRNRERERERGMMMNNSLLDIHIPRKERRKERNGYK